MARIVAVLFAFAAIVAASRAADEVLVRPDVAGPIAAYDGWLAYSARGAAPDTYRLVLRAPDGTTVETQTTQRRGGPYDVDLGPDVDGGLVAAYTLAGVPYLYDVADKAERRLAEIDAPDGREQWPSVWRGRIAFQRVYDAKPAYPYLYTSRYDREVRSTRMPGGARKECVRMGGRLSCSPDTQSRATSIELQGTRMAFAWTYAGQAEGLDTEIRLDTIGGGHEVVQHQEGGGLTQVALGWPGVAQGRLYWPRACTGDPGGCPMRHQLLRRRIPGGPIDSLVGPLSVVSHDREAHHDYVRTDTGGVGDCQNGPPTGASTCELRRISYPGSP